MGSHDIAPITNGVAHSPSQDLNNTQTSVASSSDIPNSSETGGSLLPSSSLTVPEDATDRPDTMSDESLLDPKPAVIDQQTSNSHEMQSPTAEPKVETNEPEQQKPTAGDPEPMNGIIPDATRPHLSTVDLQSETDFPPSPADVPTNTSDPTAPSETNEASKDANPESVSSQKPSVTPSMDLPADSDVLVPEVTSTETPLDPPPSPEKPVEASTISTEPETTADQLMPDAPPSPAKVARERDDDDLEDGPATKRSKTEGDSSSDFKIPERPAINTQVGGDESKETTKESQPITSVQHKALARVMANVKRVQAAGPFRLPVDILALNIPSYPNYVTKPMDLKTLEDNLKAGIYPTMDAFVADFNQIVENTRIFNGPEHGITKSAVAMKDSFDRQMEKVPGPEVVDSGQVDRKKKSIIPPAAKISAPRRESRSSLPGAGRSPVSTASTPTFALGPQGVPLIRRDSTFGDGRPKREIHPPAPRDLPYANQKPKKKKYQYELKFCDKIMSELSRSKYTPLTGPFLIPVDPVALNIPTYHSIIKKPMDFGTIRSKLDHGEYENAKEFEADVKLIFQNCYKFNPPNEWVYNVGKQLEVIFDSEWAKKRDWIEANTPASGAQSPGSSDAEDSDEDEEEEEEDEEASQLSKLQQQIAQMSKQVEMITQKKRSPPVSGKKAIKGAKPARKDSKKSSAPAKVEKKAASKPAKKPPYVTYEQKQDISNRINALSESKMSAALNIIRSSMPNLKVRQIPKEHLFIFVYCSQLAM